MEAAPSINLGFVGFLRGKVSAARLVPLTGVGVFAIVGEAVKVCGLLCTRQNSGMRVMTLVSVMTFVNYVSCPTLWDRVMSLPRVATVWRCFDHAALADSICIARKWVVVDWIWLSSASRLDLMIQALILVWMASRWAR